MAECEPDLPPAEESVYSTVIHSLHHKTVRRATNQSMPSSLHTDATHDSCTTSSLAKSKPRATQHENSAYGEALSGPKSEVAIEQDVLVRSRGKHDTRAKSRHGAVTTMRSTQIRAMLLRYQVLQATVLGLECRRKSNKTAAAIQSHYETMQNLAQQACLLSQGLKDADLLANSEYWAECARACKGSQDDDIDRCKTMPVLGQICRINKDGQDLGTDMAAKEVQEDDSSLRDTTERNAGKEICDRSSPSSRPGTFQKQKCVAQRQDSSSPEQCRTIKDELDAVLEYLDQEDGYGDSMAYLEDGEPFDPLRLLSCAP